MSWHFISYLVSFSSQKSEQLQDFSVWQCCSLSHRRFSVADCSELPVGEVTPIDTSSVTWPVSSPLRQRSDEWVLPNHTESTVFTHLSVTVIHKNDQWGLVHRRFVKFPPVCSLIYERVVCPRVTTESTLAIPFSSDHTLFICVIDVKNLTTVAHSGVK